MKLNVREVVPSAVDVLALATVPLTSHISDLDAGVPSDGAPLRSGWGLVAGVAGQGAVAAVAAQVSAVACFGAETCRRLDQTEADARCHCLL